MRILIFLGLVAFLAIALAADQSDSNAENNSSGQSDSNNNSTDAGSVQEGSDEDQVIPPKPRWPRWGGIGPVVLSPRPTRQGTL